jgi:surface polysaccharide O-acyltransferase-like enzyme
LPGHETHLTLFDTWTLILCVVVATLLMVVRRLRNVPHQARQWLDDALNVGTIFVIGALLVSSLPWFDFAYVPNPLTGVALIYCGGLIVSAMYRSLLKTTPTTHASSPPAPHAPPPSE